jgi:hypothetical protein
MKGLFRIACVLGVVAAVAALAGVNHASARVACNPGTTYSGVATYTQYCGPAKASVTVNGKKAKFANGSCSKVHNGPFKFSVHVGKSTYGVPKPKYNYFQLDAQSDQPGTSKNGGVTYQLSNGKKGQYANAKVTLNGGLKSGYFKAGSKKHPVTGTFHC